MKIKWGSTWLADDDAPAFGVDINGQQVVQEVQFIRAASQSFFSRHNRSLAITFSTTRSFGTIKAAEEFKLTHHDDLADTDDLEIKCGLTSETPTTVIMEDAVLASVHHPSSPGVMVTTEYVIKCSRVTSVDTGITEDDLQSGSISIPSGVSQYSVTGQAFTSVPIQIFMEMIKPDEGAQIHANLVASSTDTDGFDVEFGATIPSSGYTLMYLAITP